MVTTRKGFFKMHERSTRKPRRSTFLFRAPVASTIPTPPGHFHALQQPKRRNFWKRFPYENSWADATRFTIQKIQEVLGLKSTETVVSTLQKPWQAHAVLKVHERNEDEASITINITEDISRYRPTADRHYYFCGVSKVQWAKYHQVSY